MAADQSPDLEWRGRVPVATRFDDPYFSLENGMAETAHVFLSGNRLPARFGKGFHIAELGFGTGLNLAVAVTAWRDSGQEGPLHFTTFEAFPMDVADMRQALAAFPGAVGALAPVLDALAAGESVIDAPGLKFELIRGDARETVRRWRGAADAWFLDGFAPAKNPELWEPSLLAEVFRHTTPGGTAATYSAAGHVRRALADAGYQVDRVPGYGRKRHMTVAQRP